MLSLDEKIKHCVDKAKEEIKMAVRMTNEEAVIWLNTDDYASAGYGEALAMAIKALEQQRWIPVSERLPKKSGYYLVSTIGFEVWISAYDHNSKYWFYERDTYPMRKIYAWQKLPESYKGESESE